MGYRMVQWSILVLSIFMLGCGSVKRAQSPATKLVSQAAEGLSSVTYISVGDSTRAKSVYKGGYLFSKMQKTLSTKGVDSILLARRGQTLSDFNNNQSYPATKDVISKIAGDGSKTIVDISLGLNDCINKETKKMQWDLEQSIAKIRRAKPKTHFMLTTPNRMIFDEDGTKLARDVYHATANKLNIPLNTVVDTLMPSAEVTPAMWYHDDGIHLSPEGQYEVAQFILDNMLEN